MSKPRLMCNVQLNRARRLRSINRALEPGDVRIVRLYAIWVWNALRFEGARIGPHMIFAVAIGKAHDRPLLMEKARDVSPDGWRVLELQERSLIEAAFVVLLDEDKTPGLHL